MAEIHGIDTKKSHPVKAKAARQLYTDGHFSVDLHDTLILLNEARKETNYDELDPDLENVDTEDIYGVIDTCVSEAEAAT